MNITYRKANINDAYGIRYVAAYSWLETYKGLLPEEYLIDRIKNIKEKEQITKDFIKKNPNYTIALDENKIIGICNYTNCNINEYHNYGKIEALYLLKDYQKLGIGKELFKIAVEDLIKKGYQKLELECMKGNNTIDFYKKYGGKIVKTIDYPINRVGNVKADIVIFEDLNKVYNKLINKKVR